MRRIFFKGKKHKGKRNPLLSDGKFYGIYPNEYKYMKVYRGINDISTHVISDNAAMLLDFIDKNEHSIETMYLITSKGVKLDKEYKMTKGGDVVGYDLTKLIKSIYNDFRIVVMFRKRYSKDFYLFVCDNDNKVLT